MIRFTNFVIEMRRRIRGIRMCGKKYSLDSYMDMVQGLMVEQSLPLCSEDEREDASNGNWALFSVNLQLSLTTFSFALK